MVKIHAQAWIDVHEHTEKFSPTYFFHQHISPTSLQPFHPTSPSTIYNIAQNVAQWRSWSGFLIRPQIDLTTSETDVDTTAVNTTAVAITTFPTTSPIIFSTTSMNTMILKDVYDGTKGCNLKQTFIANNVTVGVTCYRKG